MTVLFFYIFVDFLDRVCCKDDKKFDIHVDLDTKVLYKISNSYSTAC